MSDIIINGDHCALILSKEEALVIYALVGRLLSGSVDGSNSIYNTIINSGFISREEYHVWWGKHAIKAMKGLKCDAGDLLKTDSVLIVKKP